MAYWLKVAGTGDAPITNPDWYAVGRAWARQYGEFSGFSKRPSVKVGDRLVSYAAGSGRIFGAPRIFAVYEAISEPDLSTHDRWVWGIETELVIGGPLLTDAPTLHEIGVDPKSVRSHSHIRLTDDQGHRAEELLRRAAEEYGSAVPVAPRLAEASPTIRSTQTDAPEIRWGRLIPNDELTEDLLPAPAAPWSELVFFAGTFDGYEALGGVGPDGLLARTEPVHERFVGEGSLPDDLTELRVALFAEQRLDHHTGSTSDPERVRYIHALVEAIRKQVCGVGPPTRPP